MSSRSSAISDTEAILARVTAHFDAAIDLFQDTVDRIRAGEDLSFTDAEKTARTLSAATQNLLTMRMKLDDEKRKAGGGDGGFDLDEARDHVGRLLDRLRAARDPG